MLRGRCFGLRGILVLVSLACRPGSDKAAELQESWKAYREHFIQEDGRVIDYRRDRITTSEGQAYAMLRAVWMGDRPTFDKVLLWARQNLNQGVRTDHLWAWKWGKTPGGDWRVLDSAFASDADEDAALALVFAAQTWSEPLYLAQAREILADLWDHGTVLVQGRRFLLGGDSLCQGGKCRLNPSYSAPYAYRIFSECDKGHDWSALVDASYFLLEEDVRLTSTHLPTDWVILDTGTGVLSLGSEEDSLYSYDAFRAHWRVALDAATSRDPRARHFLGASLEWLRKAWVRDGKLPAAISKEGTAAASYESLGMIGALMPAFADSSPEISAAMSRRLDASYRTGFWEDKDNYYLQNWAWFGTALYEKRLVLFHPE